METSRFVNTQACVSARCGDGVGRSLGAANGVGRGACRHATR